MTKRAFGELEIQILQIMNKEQRLTVKDVHRFLGGKDNYNTIMTVMNRLVEKKQMRRERMGLQYEYWLPETGVAPPSLLAKIKQMCAGVGMKALVAHLIEEEEISDAELAEMEQLIQSRKKKKK